MNSLLTWAKQFKAPSGENLLSKIKEACAKGTLPTKVPVLHPPIRIDPQKCKDGFNRGMEQARPYFGRF